MQGRSQKYDRIAWFGFRNDRSFFRLFDQCLDAMAPGPDDCRTILLGEGCERPHHIHEIFDVSERTLPHILIAVRNLRQRARMELDRLGEIELDRKSVVWGKSVSVRVDLGGGRV